MKRDKLMISPQADILRAWLQLYVLFLIILKIPILLHSGKLSAAAIYALSCRVIMGTSRNYRFQQSHRIRRFLFKKNLIWFRRQFVEGEA